MKLLFLNYEYPPLGGGAATATEAILTEFAKKEDLEVHLVTSAVGSSLDHLRLGGEVYIHRVPIGKDPGRLHSQSIRDILVYTWKAFFFLRKLMRTEKRPFDATIAFFTIPCGFLAAIVKRLAGIPYVVSLRGADVPGFSEKYDAFYLVLKPLVRFLWRDAKRVIPNSAGIRDLALETAPGQPMHVIENGVATDLFKPAPENRSRETTVYLSTSRLTKRKGIDTLIRAFAHMKSSTGELWLIGEGEERGALQDLARTLGVAERVKFLGRIEHRLLPPFYQQAHVFVLPSKNEGMSNAALEALASGLPLVVSGTGGMSELVTEGENGFFIDPDDTTGFARTLNRFAEDRSLSERLGMESRKRAEARSWSAVAEAFLSASR